MSAFCGKRFVEFFGPEIIAFRRVNTLSRCRGMPGPSLAFICQCVAVYAGAKSSEMNPHFR